MNKFLKIMGNNSSNRILYYFLNLDEGQDISIKDIVVGTKIKSKITINKCLNNLIEENIINITRKIGSTFLFERNETSQIIKKLLKLNSLLHKREEEDKLNQ